ncbi:MAG: class I tRNA ligase family protein, partial [Actinobacteria bacterium]|nr:class I tRNA ligase family protein [Actinomycetota bacterium]
VEHRVIPWDDVSLEEGTGIVHIAPGCGAEDFELGKTHKLPVLVPIDESGRFYEAYGWLHGRSTADAAQTIIGEVGERGRLVEATTITHRYPTCWRCHTELVWRVVDEWFIRCDEIREPMIEAARTVEWTPPQYGKRMEDWLRNMGDWCISRKRYWGLPLPFWFCADGHMTLVTSKDELLQKALTGTEQLEELHRPWIDAVTVPCAECGKEATRTKDVGDCWLDAGIVPFSTLGWKNTAWKEHGYAEGAGVGLTGADLPDNAYWERWFPVAWVSEMREQIRLWFYSLLFMSVLLDGRAPYQRVLTYEKVNDETGRPMHKSWGNMIEANEAMETMGADVMRWLYATQAPAQNLNFGYGPAADVKRRYLTFWNTYSFFVTYASIEGYEPRATLLSEGPRSDNALDRWMVARTQRLVRTCRAALDAFDSPAFARAVEAYWEDLSNWYVRLSRARFYSSADTGAFETLWYCLAQATRLMAPVMPFISDHIWRNLAGDESVHLAGYPEYDARLDDESLVAAMTDVRAVVELGRQARAEANLKLRQPLRAVIVATEDPGSRARLDAHASIVTAELNVKELRLTDSREDFADVEIVPNFRLLGPKYGKDAGRIQQMLKAGDYERTDGVVRAGGWTLDEGEFEVRTRAREGFAIVDGYGFAVALDTEVTPELALEGRATDVKRTIQDMRKDAGLELTDRIRITYPPDLGDVFETYGDWIKSETLALDTTQGDTLRVDRA